MRKSQVERRRSRTATLVVAALLAAPVALAPPAFAAAGTSAKPSSSSYVLVSAPPKVSAGATAYFAFAARSSGTGKIGSLQVAVPAGFTPRLPLGFGVTWRRLVDAVAQDVRRQQPRALRRCRQPGRAG